MLRKSFFAVVLIFVVLSSHVISLANNNLITNRNFEGGVGLPWHVICYDDADVDYEIKDNQYIITVNDPGEHSFSVQFRHLNIPINAGWTYFIEFTVVANKYASIYTSIGIPKDPYIEYWNNNWSGHSLEANEPYTYMGSFHTKTSDPLAAWTFHLGIGGQSTVQPGTTLKFSNMRLYTYNSKPPPPPPTPTPRRVIRVNQVGYFSQGVKRATIINSSATKWELKNSNDTTVAVGTTVPFGLDKDSGDNVQIIDFSNYKTPGKGYYLVAENERSYPFDINSHLYEEMMYDAFKYFYYNRAGEPIEADYAHDISFVRPAGHTNDIAEATSEFGFTGGYTLDVTGGWYDAGNYGRYVVHGGISTWIMQNQYERALKNGMIQQLYRDGKFNIPESGNGIPDILDESRFNMEFMLKMQVPIGPLEGMVHHKTHDQRWQALGMGPHESTEQPRIIKPPSTAATLNLAATAAQAARIWKDIDPEFSNECLTAADTAWEAAIANPDIYAPFNDNIGGAPYGDDYVLDDFYWAACELLITTGDLKYLSFIRESPYFLQMPDYIRETPHFLQQPDKLTSEEATSFVGPFDWANTSGVGTLSLALHEPSQLTASEIATAKANIAKACDIWIEYQQNQGYGVTIEQRQVFFDNPNLIGYPWSSNSYILNQCIVFGYAYEYTNDSKYYNALTEAMDYIMGRNPMNQCYVTGYGSIPLKNPHHRWFSYQFDSEYPKAPPGWISSGPNSGLQDPWVKGFGWQPGGHPPQKCFMDHIESWSTNEATISLNASLAWVTGFLSESDCDCGHREIFLADLNGDRKIDSTDAALMRRYILEIPVNFANLEAADLNQDGVINSIDYVLLKRYILEIIW
ncbi:UNVERIFIED_CONTAM: endoglucanase [Acetivibrio alkalicellulosi]